MNIDVEWEIERTHKKLQDAVREESPVGVAEWTKALSRLIALREILGEPEEES